MHNTSDLRGPILIFFLHNHAITSLTTTSRLITFHRRQPMNLAIMDSNDVPARDRSFEHMQGTSTLYHGALARKRGEWNPTAQEKATAICKKITNALMSVTCRTFEIVTDTAKQTLHIAEKLMGVKIL